MRKSITMIAAVGLAAVFGGKAWACPGNASGNKFTAGALRSSAHLTSAALTAGSPDASQDSGNGSGKITGLWDTKFYDPTGTILEDEAYETFTSDGQELMVDTSPPAIDNVCNGIWLQTGPATYKLKHVAWTFDPSGNLLGSAVFQTVITLGNKANTFTGTTTILAYDTYGNLQYEVQGVVKGTRITVDF